MGVTHDGLGVPLAPEREYYVQDTRNQVGNCALWWGKERSGYTTELDRAGIYKGFDCMRLRPTDVPYPREIVEANVVRHVRCDGDLFACRVGRTREA